jgi:hypothetical protein
MKKLLTTLLLVPFMSLAQMDTSLKDSINGNPVIESHLINISGEVLESKLSYETKDWFNLFGYPSGVYYIVQYTNVSVYVRRYIIN